MNAPATDQNKNPRYMPLWLKAGAAGSLLVALGLFAARNTGNSKPDPAFNTINSKHMLAEEIDLPDRLKPYFAILREEYQKPDTLRSPRLCDYMAGDALDELARECQQPENKALKEKLVSEFKKILKEFGPIVHSRETYENRMEIVRKAATTTAGPQALQFLPDHSSPDGYDLALRFVKNLEGFIEQVEYGKEVPSPSETQRQWVKARLEEYALQTQFRKADAITITATDEVKAAIEELVTRTKQNATEWSDYALATTGVIPGTLTITDKAGLTFTLTLPSTEEKGSMTQEQREKAYLDSYSMDFTIRFVAQMVLEGKATFVKPKLWETLIPRADQVNDAVKNFMDTLKKDSPDGPSVGR